jgi:hypothetical protein
VSLAVDHSAGHDTECGLTRELVTPRYRTGLLDIAVRGPGGPVRAIHLDGRVAPRLIRPEAGTRRYLEMITG